MEKPTQNEALNLLAERHTPDPVDTPTREQIVKLLMKHLRLTLFEGAPCVEVPSLLDTADAILALFPSSPAAQPPTVVVNTAQELAGAFLEHGFPKLFTAPMRDDVRQWFADNWIERSIITPGRFADAFFACYVALLTAQDAGAQTGGV